MSTSKINASITELEDRLKHTEIAIGLILKSLSEHTSVDLTSVLNGALLQAETLNKPGQVSRIIGRLSNAPEEPRQIDQAFVEL